MTAETVDGAIADAAAVDPDEVLDADAFRSGVPATGSRAGLRARVVDHVRSPLTRNGYALLLSSVITSVLGLAYWVLAARLYSEGALGRGAALVSTMLFVTTLATAGLKRGLIRFVSGAGPDAPGVVRRIYTVGLGIGLAGGGVFLFAFHGRSGDLPMLRGPWPAVAFLLGIVAWALFVLQDPVLVGAHRSTLVPFTNTVFSVLKIALLVLGYHLLAPSWGVFASWVVPAAVMAVAVNIWLFRRGLRSVPRRGDGRRPRTAELVRFTSGEYVATLAWHACNYLTPLLVIGRAGAAANARYYMAAQISYTLFLVSSNVTDALVADGSRDPAGLGRKVRRTSLQTALVLVPGVVVTVLAAPQIMALFGSGYTGDAVATLRILALAAVPNAVTTVVVGVAHVRQRISTVIALQVSMSALALGASWVLIDGQGIVGVAWAWLGAQLVTSVLAVGLALRSEPGLRRAVLTGGVARASAIRARGARRRAERVLRDRLASLPAELGPLDDTSLLAFQHDLLVLRASVDGSPAVLRLAAGAQGRRGIAAHRSQLQALHADAQLAPLHPVIPRVLRSDPGATWLVETLVDGTSAASLPAGERRDRAVAAGLTVLDRLHGQTARRLVVGPELVSLWVHEPVTTVAAVIDDPGAVRGLAALHRRLREELTGTRVTVARLHGDPSLDNLLFADDGSAVTGMVDWESSTIGLPECDLMVLVLARRVAQGGELGAEVLDLLASGWSAEERELLGTSWSLNDHVRPTTAVLLTWLAHVAANLEKTDRYRANRWWIRHNVEAVLASLDDGTVPSFDDPEVDGADPVRDAVDPATVGPTGPAPVAIGSRVRLSTPALRVAVVVAAGAALAAGTWGAPPPARVALVLLATVALPALVIGRCLGTPGPLVHGVIGVAGAVSGGLVLAEAQLYAGVWSPRWWVVLVGVATLVLSSRIPPYQPTRPTPPTPADAIVRRARSSRTVA